MQIGLDFLAQLGETDFAPALIVAGYCDPSGGPTPSRWKNGRSATRYSSRAASRACPPPIGRKHYDGIGADGRERYAPAYPQESIEMDIRDSGVTYMYWSTPSELGRTLNENVTLMPFEQVVERFCDQILYSAHARGGGNRFSDQKDAVHRPDRAGDGAALQRGSVEEWVMVPAWTFFGRTGAAIRGA